MSSERKRFVPGEQSWREPGIAGRFLPTWKQSHVLNEKTAAAESGAPSYFAADEYPAGPKHQVAASVGDGFLQLYRPPVSSAGLRYFFAPFGVEHRLTLDVDDFVGYPHPRPVSCVEHAYEQWLAELTAIKNTY